MEPLSLLGPIDALEPFIEYVILALVLANLVTRQRAHFNYVRQAEASDGSEEMSRSLLHEATNVLLVLAAFYYATVSLTAGTVLSVLVVGMVLTDFFEAEARMVEARKGDPLDKPKGAIFAWGLVLLYAAYHALFHLVEGPFGAIV